jgi:hypothetical protein
MNILTANLLFSTLVLGIAAKLCARTATVTEVAIRPFSVIRPTKTTVRFAAVPDIATDAACVSDRPFAAVPE